MQAALEINVRQSGARIQVRLISIGRHLILERTVSDDAGSTSQRQTLAIRSVNDIREFCESDPAAHLLRPQYDHVMTAYEALGSNV